MVLVDRPSTYIEFVTRIVECIATIIIGSILGLIFAWKLALVAIGIGSISLSYTVLTLLLSVSLYPGCHLHRLHSPGALVP